MTLLNIEDNGHANKLLKDMSNMVPQPQKLISELVSMVEVSLCKTQAKPQNLMLLLLEELTKVLGKKEISIIMISNKTTLLMEEIIGIMKLKLHTHGTQSPDGSLPMMIQEVHAKK